MKYRVGNHTGLVILTTDDSKEVAHCVNKEIAQEICYLLNNKNNSFTKKLQTFLMKIKKI